MGRSGAELAQLPTTTTLEERARERASERGACEPLHQPPSLSPSARHSADPDNVPRFICIEKLILIIAALTTAARTRITAGGAAGFIVRRDTARLESVQLLLLATSAAEKRLNKSAHNSEWHRLRDV